MLPGTDGAENPNLHKYECSGGGLVTVHQHTMGEFSLTKTFDGLVSVINNILYLIFYYMFRAVSPHQNLILDPIYQFTLLQFCVCGDSPSHSRFYPYTESSGSNPEAQRCVDLLRHVFARMQPQPSILLHARIDRTPRFIILTAVPANRLTFTHPSNLP